MKRTKKRCIALLVAVAVGACGTVKRDGLNDAGVDQDAATDAADDAAIDAPTIDAGPNRCFVGFSTLDHCTL